MPRYRVTTPNTPRVTGKPFADFAQAHECSTIACVRTLLVMHYFNGCTVHRKRREGWVLEFDSTSTISQHTFAELRAHWGRVEAAQ